jgi:hypothetical protein
MTSITWVASPSLAATTNNGELIRRFEDATGLKVKVIVLPMYPLENVHPSMFKEAASVMSRR